MRPTSTGPVPDPDSRGPHRGKSYARIAAARNTDGVPTGQGGAHWYRATVRAVHQFRPADHPVDWGM